jgi:hypothetical protein
MLMLVLAALLIAGCGDDDPAGPPETPDLIILNHDGDHEASPFLDGGSWEAAAYFPLERMAPLADGELREVVVYINSLPSAATVRVYGEGANGEPGAVLYEASVTGRLTAGSWNVHALTEPLAISGHGLWIAIAFSHADRQATIGCDPGPAVENGDWTYSGADEAWRTLRERTGVNINWNIRGGILPQADAPREVRP